MNTPIKGMTTDSDKNCYFVLIDGDRAVAAIDKRETHVDAKALAHQFAASGEVLEALALVDKMFSNPTRINRIAVRDRVRAALALSKGESA